MFVYGFTKEFTLNAYVQNVNGSTIDLYYAIDWLLVLYPYEQTNTKGERERIGVKKGDRKCGINKIQRMPFYQSSAFHVFGILLGHLEMFFFWL